MNILKWVENYIQNLPPKASYSFNPGGTQGGAVPSLLDVYGTEGTKDAKTTTFGPSKKPLSKIKKRSKAEIEATLAFVRKNYGW